MSAALAPTFAAMGLLIGCGTSAKQALPAPHRVQAQRVAVSYAGIDYEQPDEGLTGCPYYTWLKASCYTNSTLTAHHVSPQQQLSRDMSWITAQHMGNFQRVFVSLDELFSCFSASTGFCGYDARALANVDDALSIIARAHQKADLVLLLQDDTAGFNFEALDGYHPAMEQAYVTAVRQFVEHVAANPTDSSAVAVMDLQNEAYYQIPAHLMKIHNICGTDWGCVYERIAHPWLIKLYKAAKSAGPQFQYTVSSTDNLLKSSQAYFLALYAGIADVFDIHLYSGAPWSTTSEYASSAGLGKPWFVGEAGCASNGSTLCSYDGGNVACRAPDACSLSIDKWWLENLPTYGAYSVLIANTRTCFSVTPSGSPTTTLVGRQVSNANAGAPAPP